MERMWEKKGVYRILVGNSERKRSLGSPRRGGMNTIEMDLQEVGCRVMDWIELAQNRDRNERLRMRP